VPLAPPTDTGPPVAHTLSLPVQAEPVPQRQIGVVPLVSHHSPAAQQLVPQQMPDVQDVQFGAHEWPTVPPPPVVQPPPVVPPPPVPAVAPP